MDDSNSLLLEEIQNRTKSEAYTKKIEKVFDTNAQIKSVTWPEETSTKVKKKSGKVRDQYDFGNQLALITTDRQSGFDRILTNVPYKGQVLNLTSAFWFEQTKDIIPNHLINVPHPNVSIVQKCTPFPIEFVVRSYMTGSTSTSIWKNYQNGVRLYCGHVLPEGMKKNQKLETNLLTPTTKEENHDRPISKEDIINEKIMTKQDFDCCEEAALAIFARGQEIASKRGLILVDTKYEFGKAVDGTIVLIDEVHTPDSSRYWLTNSYAKRMEQGQEPENIDKEFLRLWFANHCDPYQDLVLPEAPKDLVMELSRRYILLYEMITCCNFSFDDDTSTATTEKDIVQSILTTTTTE